VWTRPPAGCASLTKAVIRMAFDKTLPKSENGFGLVDELIEELDLYSAGFDFSESDPATDSCATTTCGCTATC